MTRGGLKPVTPGVSRQLDRIEVVHSLRGLAALSVALYHFCWGNASFAAPPMLKAITSHGWLGVQVFFVISGFVLPYSLWRAGYKLSPSNFGRFVLKRVVRLDPPYFAVIVLVLILAFASTLVPGFRGEPFHFDLEQTVLHVGYLNGLAGAPWLNPVFWTLAIECQFYLLIAVIFPLTISRRQRVRLIGFGALLMASTLAPRVELVTYHLPLFIFGIVAFQQFAGICSRQEAGDGPPARRDPAVPADGCSR